MDEMGIRQFNGIMMKAVQPLVPLQFSWNATKGQAGRIGVVGGCDLYTGAPYFAAYAALLLGADLSTVFTTPEAAIPIKSYSPELMVHPTLVGEVAHECEERAMKRLQAQESMMAWIPKLHALVLGPGLGRDPSIRSQLAKAFKTAKDSSLPIVVDGDGLWFLLESPDWINGYNRVVLTPNEVEFQRLWQKFLPDQAVPMPITTHLDQQSQFVDPDSSTHVQSTTELARKLGVTIVRKGLVDIISDGETAAICAMIGSPRRCGGQGDVLAGAIGTFLCWQHNIYRNEKAEENSVMPKLSGSHVAAALGACMVTRCAARFAFAKRGRSTLTSDLLNDLGRALDDLAPRFRCMNAS